MTSTSWGFARRWPAGEVEVLDIDGRAGGELLDLALAEPLAGRGGDRGGRLRERSPRSLDRGQPPQPVGVPLAREVQLAVGRVEVGVREVAVGEPGDRDGPEDRAERAGVPSLDRAVPATVGIDHLLDPPFPDRAQLQLPLQQLAQQLPTAPIQLLFELGMARETPKGVLPGAHRRPPAGSVPARRRPHSRARPASAWASRSARSGPPTSGKDPRYKPMVKSEGGQRESDGIVVPRIGARNAPGGKGPDFDHAGGAGKREGMTGEPWSNNPGRRESADAGRSPDLGEPRPVKVRELQRKLWAAAKQSEGRRFNALYELHGGGSVRPVIRLDGPRPST
jgi:hypothetical protein